MDTPAPAPIEKPVISPITNAEEFAKAEAVTADDLVDNNLVSGNPAVMENLAQPPAPEFSVPAVSDVPIDASGQKFDPTRHHIDENGKPRVNFKGNFYGTGRKKKNPENAQPVFDTPPGEVQPDKYPALAETLLRIGYGPLELVLSEEIRTTPEEHQALKLTLAEWLRVSEMQDLPPWLAFTCVAAGVYLPKFSKPTVKERLTLVWLKMRTLFSRKKKPNFVPSPPSEQTESSEKID